MKQSPCAADMLSLIVMLDRRGISKELLQKPQDTLLEFRAAVAKLKSFPLVSEEKSSSKYSVHRLVQISTQKWLVHNRTISLPLVVRAPEGFRTGPQRRAPPNQ